MNRAGRLKQLASQSFVYGLGGLVSKAVGIFLLPIYTRRQEDSDELRDDPAEAVDERLAGQLLQPGAHAGVLGSRAHR